MGIDNRFILEMIGRHRSEEILRDAERARLLREAELENGKRLWDRVVAWIAGTAQAVKAAETSSASETGGRMANATSAREVPGL